MRKIVETRSSLSNTIKDTSTIMRNPSLHNSEKGVMHDCASILDSIAKGTSCFHYFSHGASLHPHSFSRMIFTLVLLHVHMSIGLQPPNHPPQMSTSVPLRC